VSVLRDVALILLALDGAVLTLAALVVLAMINYGLVRFRWWHTIPGWFAIGRHYLALGQSVVERVCRAVAAPIFVVKGSQAGLAAGTRGLVQAGQELLAGPARKPKP
jgi:hypothetical protein